MGKAKNEIAVFAPEPQNILTKAKNCYNAGCKEYRAGNYKVASFALGTAFRLAEGTPLEANCLAMWSKALARHSADLAAAGDNEFARAFIEPSHVAYRKYMAVSHRIFSQAQKPPADFALELILPEDYSLMTENIKRQISFKPKNAALHGYLADIHFDMGNFEEAANVYSIAISRSKPGSSLHVEHLISRADALLMAGKKHEATECLKSALTFSPGKASEVEARFKGRLSEAEISAAKAVIPSEWLNAKPNQRKPAAQKKQAAPSLLRLG